MTTKLIASALIAALGLSACSNLPGIPSGSPNTAPADVGASDAGASGALAESSATKDPEVAPPTAPGAAATTDAVPATGAVATTEAAPPTTAAPDPTEALNINTGGPTVCIDAVLAHIGPDAMVNEISSYFETGEDIEEPLVELEGEEPAVPGQLFICTAEYQDPSNPLKLVGIQMDTDTGEFSEPEPVEIDVIGDATEFDLNDYIMKASDINPSVIQPTMDAKAPGLNEMYRLWRWNRVSLVAPGPFNDVHVFDLRMEGRLASNDINNSGYVTVAMDGSIVLEYLE